MSSKFRDLGVNLVLTAFLSGLVSFFGDISFWTVFALLALVALVAHAIEYFQQVSKHSPK